MAESSITDWITAIAAVVTAVFAGVGVFAIFFSAKQTKLLKKQIADDHERSRRQSTIDLLWKFTEHVKGLAAADFLESLSEPAARAVFNCERLTVDIDERQLNRIQVCLSGSNVDVPQATGEIRLNQRQVSVIQNDGMKYLNIIETILLAWKFRIADQEMIEAQFGYLHDPERGRNCLQHFRNASGGDKNFPAIGAFLRTLHAKRQIPGTYTPLG